MASYNEQISVIFIRYLKLTRTAMPCGLGMQYSVCSIQYSTFFEIAIILDVFSGPAGDPAILRALWYYDTGSPHRK